MRIKEEEFHLRLCHDVGETVAVLGLDVPYIMTNVNVMKTTKKHVQSNQLSVHKNSSYNYFSLFISYSSSI